MRRPGRTVGLVAAALLLAGCAEAQHNDPPLSGPPGPVSVTSRPAAGPSTEVLTPASISIGAQHNRGLATAEAQHLLDVAELPASARQLTAAPDWLGGSALGTPASTSLVDIATFWEVPLSQQAAGDWIRTHPPRGLDADRSSPGVDGPAPSDIVTGFGFSDHRTTQAWTEGVLDISVSVVDGNTSAWRVEGQAIWLDPAPAQVEPGGARLRVEVQDSCPLSDQGKTGVTNTAAGLNLALVPPESPSGGLVCVYHGANGPAFRLAGQHVLSVGTARSLAQLIDHVSLARPTGDTAWTCPMDDGAAAVLVLSYPGETDVDLWLHTTGCPLVDNGEIEALFGTGVSALIDAVLAAR